MGSIRTIFSGGSRASAAGSTVSDHTMQNRTPSAVKTPSQNTGRIPDGVKERNPTAVVTEVRTRGPVICSIVVRTAAGCGPGAGWAASRRW